MTDPKKWLINLLLSLPFLAAFFVPQNALATTTPPAVLRAELVPICSCESTGKLGNVPTQYDKDGNVLHGKKNPDDIGMCQINQFWNGKEATEHGWDIYTEQGNIRMANYLYETQGTTPWNSSSSCWSS